MEEFLEKCSNPAYWRGMDPPSQTCKIKMIEEKSIESNVEIGDFLPSFK